jgi:hypothetical protein
MDQVGVSMDTEDGDEADLTAHADDSPGADTAFSTADDDPKTRRQEEDRLGVFRDFINSLDLDDFDRKRSS